MDASALQLLVPIAGIVAILFAIYLARDVLSRDTGTEAMQEVAGTIFEGAVAFIRRQYTTIFILAIVGAVDHRDRHHAGRDARSRGRAQAGRLAHRPDDRLRLLRRRAVFDGLRHHRHVRRRQGQCPDRISGTAQPRRGRPGGDARRGRVRVPRRRAFAPRRVGHLHAVRHGRRGRDRQGGAVPDRRVRLRRLVRRAVRPARRRHLHQGRRRRVGSRRQGREGHPRGRPAQRGRGRGPRRRQRRRLRRPWRRPVRIDGRREHRRDDPGRRGLLDRA